MLEQDGAKGAPWNLTSRSVSLLFETYGGGFLVSSRNQSVDGMVHGVCHGGVQLVLGRMERSRPVVRFVPLRHDISTASSSVIMSFRSNLKLIGRAVRRSWC